METIDGRVGGVTEQGGSYLGVEDLDEEDASEMRVVA